METNRAKAPASGDVVFNIHGQQASYIGRHLGDHLVAPIYEDHDGEEYMSDQPEVWREIYAEPPTVKLHDKVAELDKAIEERRAELKRINQELDVSGKRYADTVKKLQKHLALERVEDYLDGKFTLFLEVPDYELPRIRTLNDVLDQKDRYDRDRKLLTLFGKTNGDLAWRINRYSDGSGNWTDVYPCETEEQAIEILRDLYKDACDQWREQPGKHHGNAIRWAKLPANWITVPDDVQEYLKNAKLDGVTKALEKAKETLSAAQREYDEAVARSASPNSAA